MTNILAGEADIQWHEATILQGAEGAKFRYYKYGKCVVVQGYYIVKPNTPYETLFILPNGMKPSEPYTQEWIDMVSGEIRREIYIDEAGNFIVNHNACGYPPGTKRPITCEFEWV